MEIPVVQEQVIVHAIPEVVGSLPPVEEFTVPVYDQVHQERFAAGELTEFSGGNPCCSGTGDRSRNS